MVSLPVGSDDAGVRLDRFLRRRLAHFPLSQIFRLIRTGGVRVGDRRVKQDYRLCSGDVVSVRVDGAEVTDPARPALQADRDLAGTGFFRRSFRVIFEDDSLIACDKPPFLVVHPGSGHTKNDTLIDLARAHMAARTTAGDAAQPDLVHRIDKDTSGIVLIAKNKQALRALHDALRSHAIRKRYVLVCHGRPRQREGVITLELERGFERNDGTKVRVSEDGMASETRYRVTESRGGLSRLDAEIVTGRTHQIRVHCAHIGCPIVGDVRYGDQGRDAQLFSRSRAPRRLYLHAHELSFPHPVSGERVTLSSPVPEAFQQVMGAAAGRPTREQGRCACDGHSLSTA